MQAAKSFSGLKAEVVELLRKDGKINDKLVESETDWFFDKLGIGANYFTSQSAEVIAKHISAIYANKMLSSAESGKVKINIQREHKDGAIYACNSMPGSQSSPAVAIESRIDERYLSLQDDDSSFRVQVYRSTGFLSSEQQQNLRLYVVNKAKYPTNSEANSTDEIDIEKVADTSFLEKATPTTKKIYQNILRLAAKIPGPIIEEHDSEYDGRRIVICYRRGTTANFFAALTALYHYHGCIARKKNVEPFSNGFLIISLHLAPINPAASDFQKHIKLFQKEANLLYILPSSPLGSLLQSGTLSEEECVYAHAAWKFTAHFINRMGSEYHSLRSVLDMRNERNAAMMAALKRRFVDSTFTESGIAEVVMANPEMVKALYKDFAQFHASSANYILSKSEEAKKTYGDIVSTIKRHSKNEQEQQIFSMFLTFNRHVLKTNFYKVDKVALSFRLDPAFLDEKEYPQRPFGIFYIIGDEFRGFHVRFSDVARGGIRIVRSRDTESYNTNLKQVFEECYGLANTQERKNKDIPEGGSKGVILLDLKCQKPEQAENAFKKYVDSMLDLLLSHQETRPTQMIIDHYGNNEILFLGPDEGTADVMDWASQRAKERGASFWKAFTTGKSRSLGGIPHDMYGMTTRSIHQYVLGILRMLGINEEEVTKFQTGGPDGDLGSNEIKISKDKTIAIVDGSGVLYDAQGIDRTELLRLANGRKMVREFDKSKLSPAGYFIDVNDREITLPDGTKVENGLNYRNEFHLNPASSATLFVPCGGRPEAVNISNVDKFFHHREASNGKDERVPRFKYIVEGANIFFTQEARLILEEAGVTIFKDASANKGGVTSSSLEVLAALALTDDEFHTHMRVKKENGVEVVPAFYQRYIENVHEIIERNAALEFTAVWEANKKTGQPRSIIADLVSTKINDLNDHIQKSSLWTNVAFRNIVLAEACPPVLLALVGGVEGLSKRIPENYLRAIFGAYLGSRYVYRFGLETNPFDFFEFVQPYFDRIPNA